MDDLAPNIEVLWGLYRDNTLGEDVKVTLIATDFEKGDASDTAKRDEDKDRLLKDALVATYYGNNVRKPVKQPKVKEKSVAVSEVIEEVIENVPITEEISDTGIATEHMEVEEAPTRPDCTKKSFMQKFLDRLEKLMEE
jgi:cell division protein FtsZ